MWERMVLYSINTPKWTRTPFHHVCFDWTMLGVCSPEWFSMEHSRHCPSPISRDTQMNPAFLFFSAPSWLPSCLLELLSHCHPGMTKALAHRELSPRLFASLLHILWCSAPAQGKPKALPSPIVSIISTWTDKRGSSFLLCSCCWLWNVLFISPRLLLLFDPVGPYPFPQNLVPFFRWLTRLPGPFFPHCGLAKSSHRHMFVFTHKGIQHSHKMLTLTFSLWPLSHCKSITHKMASYLPSFKHFFLSETAQTFLWGVLITIWQDLCAPLPHYHISKKLDVNARYSMLAQ